MKNKVEELALMGTADVAVITPKVISGVVEEIARDNYVWASFYKVNNDLKQSGGTEVVFPKKRSGVACTFDVSPGGGVAATAMSFDAVTIAVKKAEVAIGIYGEAIRQANRDVIADNMKEAGLAWGGTLDYVAFDKMAPSTTATGCNAGTFVAASVCVVGIKSVNPSTVTGFTIINIAGSSSIAYASDVKGTVTYWYVPSTAGGRTVSAGASSITGKDILTLKAQIQANTMAPKVVVMHSDRFADVVHDAASKYSQEPFEGSPMYKGEIGQMAGLRIVVNAYCPKIAIFEIDSDSMGYQIIRKELEMQKDPYTGMSIDALYFFGFTERNFGVVNTIAWGALCMTGTYTVSMGLGQV